MEMFIRALVVFVNWWHNRIKVTGNGVRAKNCGIASAL